MSRERAPARGVGDPAPGTANARPGGESIGARVDAKELAARLRARDVSAAPALLNLLESVHPTDRQRAAELSGELSPRALGGEASGRIIGITGPPGAGKSTLLSALIKHWREQGSTVAVLAVDPSSRRSGGSLLGDRARIDVDAADAGVFVRSTAAGERLGGLAPSTRAAANALAAAFDFVVIETVGVGQAETDVANVADTVAVVVQPGSGDVLQFLKAGIMEIPDVIVVTKADLGQLAASALRDVSAALRTLGASATSVHAVSALPPAKGVEELANALRVSRRDDAFAERRVRARRSGALDEFVREHGDRGLRALGGRSAAEQLLAQQDAELDIPALVAVLELAAARA